MQGHVVAALHEVPLFGAAVSQTTCEIESL